jgi:FSR family fosmidomycin resistance protein-like MFS transporter
MMSDETKNGDGFQTGPVASITLAHATNDAYMSFLAPLLPTLIAKLTLSKTQAGLLAFLQSSPSLLQPLIGHLADRVGLRYCVILAPAVVATLMSLLGVSSHYLGLVLLVMVAGLSSASLHAVAPAITGRLSGRELGRGMGLWMVGAGLGYAVGPLVAATVLSHLGLEGMPWLMVGGWLGSGILFVRLRDVPEPHRTHGEGNSWRRALKVLRPILATVAGITTTRGLMVAAIFVFMPTLLAEEGASIWFSGASVSIVAGGAMLGSVLAGSMSDRLGRRVVLLVSMSTGPLLVFAFLGASGWVRLLILLALGLTVPAAEVVLMALVQESCPDNRALANGIFMSLVFISESVGALVVGILGDLFGLRLAFAAVALVFMLALPLVLRLPREGSTRQGK